MKPTRNRRVWPTHARKRLNRHGRARALRAIGVLRAVEEVTRA